MENKQSVVLDALPVQPVPFVDLLSQTRELELELKQAIQSTIQNGDYILGKVVREFEQAFASYIGVKFAIGVASGLDALELSLRALGIREGDEVIVPANTFIATALAVSKTGAKPVFVDCDARTHNIDVEKIEPVINGSSRAIIPVHLEGHPADMSSLISIANRHGLSIVEDACQAHGATFGNKACGSFGVAGCFSFYPAKNLGAMGDGGMVTTDDESLAHRIRCMRDYGQCKKYQHDFLGSNSRLDTLQAAVLQQKLPRLDHWNRQRNRIAEIYLSGLADVRDLSSTQVLPDSNSVWHLFVIETTYRDELADHLRKANIATGIHYPIPIHLQRAFEYLGYERGDFPVAERLSKRILSLPMYPQLKDEQCEHVVRSVREFFRTISQS